VVTIEDQFFSGFEKIARNRLVEMNRHFQKCEEIIQVRLGFEVLIEFMAFPVRG